MLWVLLALLLAVPAWLGIARSGTDTRVRRWVGRCLVCGTGIGVFLSGIMWLGSVHVPTGANLLWGPLLGASVGAAFGLVTGALWLLIARWRRGSSDSPAV